MEPGINSEGPSSEGSEPKENQKTEAVAVATHSARLRPTFDQKKLHIQQTDESSPLYSIKAFEELGLPERLLKGVYDLKYQKPSHIQEVALPAIMHKPLEHFIGQAQSGTGKTAAFSLSMLHRVNSSNKFPQALCICPTRELSRQIADAVRALAKFTDIEIYLAIPGCELPASGCLTEHVVIGTPGTVWSMIKSRKFLVKNISIFVIDEADKMINLVDDLWRTTENIRKSLDKHCQICLFSATYSEQVRRHAEKLVPVVPGRTVITLEPEQLSLDKIQEMVIDCKDQELRYKILTQILPYANVGSTIVFVRTTKTAEELGKRLVQDGFPVSIIHGGKDMSPSLRDKVMDDFRNFRTRILVATDVLSRGIDVSEVTLVLNYDLPVDKFGEPDPETYLHRIGRSGRFGRDGLAINFVHNSRTKEQLESINNFLKGSATLGKKREITELKESEISKLEQMLDELE